MERVECSADLLEVKGARMSSKSSPWTAGRDILELLTTAESATSRGAEGTGLYLRQDRSDQQSATRELAQELSTSSARSSGGWNGDAVTCRSISAGVVRLVSRTIETRYADRREARVQLWRENRTDDVSSEAHGDVADDTAENVKGTDVQVGAEEVDVADLSNKESKGSEEARRAVP